MIMIIVKIQNKLSRNMQAIYDSPFEGVSKHFKTFFQVPLSCAKKSQATVVISLGKLLWGKTFFKINQRLLLLGGKVSQTPRENLVYFSGSKTKKKNQQKKIDRWK